MNDQSNTPTLPKISKPGVYSLSNAEYHGQCCDGVSVSNSVLTDLLDKGPAKFWATSSLNPDSGEKVDAPHFRIGSAAHLLLLEPELVMKHVARIPSDILASNGAVSTKEAKAFVAEAEQAGKIPLKPDQWAEIVNMRDALAKHPHARRALIGGKPEISLILKDEPTGLWVKSRPDYLPEESGRYIVDYKTTADLSAWDRHATADFHYQMQAALMIWAAREICNIEPKGVLYLVQDKAAPYEIAMKAFTLSELSTRALLDVARLDLRDALNLFADCWNRGEWPSMWEHPAEIAAPDWLQKKVERRLEESTAGFPDQYRL